MKKFLLSPAAAVTIYLMALTGMVMALVWTVDAHGWEWWFAQACYTVSLGLALKYTKPMVTAVRARKARQ